jgi:hypothetical protein
MSREAEIQKNYKAFEPILPTIIQENDGKFALMREGKLVKIFDSPRDAVIFAESQFQDDLWSVQEISSRIADLGWFSHAVPDLAV